jgi:SEC-C motif domain protein
MRTPRLHDSDRPCPCRQRQAQPVPYAQCCQPWHEGLALGRHAPEPEALMRSRYSAYALAQRNDAQGQAMLGYLLGTWHTGTSPGELELAPLQWVGLEVLHTQTEGDAGVVEFVAHHKLNGRAVRMHETSRFLRVQGAWKYLDGDVSE